MSASTSIYRYLRRMTGPVIANHLAYLVRHRRLLRLRNPSYFSDHVVKRMLFERSDRMRWTCDKLAMKDRVGSLDVPCRIPPTLWSGDSLHRLSESELTGEWVLKPNGGGGGDVRFGSGTPTRALVRELSASFSADSGSAYHHNGEWAYSQARQGFLVEGLLAAPPIPDYKVFVFWGRAVCIDVHVGRFGRKARATYDREWRRLRPVYGDSEDLTVLRPERLSDLLRSAEAIASGFEFLRVDFYVVDDSVWFGEVTPYPAAGRSRIDREFDKFLGSLWSAGGFDRVVALSRRIESFLDDRDGERCIEGVPVLDDRDGLRR